MRATSATSATSATGLPDLDEAIPRILGAWRGHLRAGADRTPRCGARGLAERGLVAALLRAALAPEAADDALQGLVGAAVTYGSTERIRRLDPSEVCEELGALRKEVWRHLCDDGHGRGRGSSTDLRCLARLDQAVTVASSAVLRGGYACELRKLGISVESGLRDRR